MVLPESGSGIGNTADHDRYEIDKASASES